MTETIGLVRTGFEPVAEVFDDVLASRPGFGAALCVYRDGSPVVDLSGGDDYPPDGIQVTFSATKGAMAICAALCVQRGLVDVDAPVASFWPEFAANGKERVTLRQILSHRAGLPTVDQRVSLADLCDTTILLPALERQRPLWEPGTAHGYHPWTIGTLVGEVIRRVDGREPGRFFGEEVAVPLDLDLWIGLPVEQERRVVPVRTDAQRSVSSVGRPADARSLPVKVMSNGMGELTSGCNLRNFHEAQSFAATGIGDARSFARMYAACIAPISGIRLLEPDVLVEFTRPHSEEPDLVTLEHSRFGLGFMLPFERIPMAGPASFGHDGAGGALAFADPDLGISFAFLTDRIPDISGVDPCVRRLVAALLDCLPPTR